MAPARDPIDDGFPRDLWYFGAAGSQVKRGETIHREILGEPVLIGRTHEGEAFALRDVCPHRGILLSTGKIVRQDGESQVECPYHGWRFRADGGCAAIPSLTGEQADAVDLTKIRTRSWPVAERHGLVFVHFASDPDCEPVVEPPAFGIPPESKVRHVETRGFDIAFGDAVTGLMATAQTPFDQGLLGWLPAAPRAVDTRFDQPGVRIDQRRLGQRLVTSIAVVTPVNATTSAITILLSWDVPALGLLPKALIAQGVYHFLDRVGEAFGHPGEAAALRGRS